jgi:general secretion pathway protein G
MYCQSNRTVSKKRFVSSPVNPLKQGFTLVELMVSLVILALLASAVSVSIRSYLIRSKQSIAKIEISRMSQAVEAFYATFDRYPTNDEGIEVLVSKSDEFPEGLLDFLPSDPWGNSYEYRSPGDSTPFEIVSLGADRREGGTGADRDITSVELAKSRRKN